MAKLTDEELKELETLEQEEAEAKIAKDAALQRVRFDALRMRKRLALKHGKHGDDFVVVETWPLGPIAVRRPTEEEVALVQESSTDPEVSKGFVLNIALEPAEGELMPLIVRYPGIRVALMNAGYALIGALREQEAKK